MDARSASQRFRRRHRRKHDDAKSSNAGMRAQIARGLPLAKWTSGPTQFKIKTLLSHVAMYPSGARRRAGASSGRGIAIAVRDGRRGRRGAICAGVAMHRSRAVLLTPDDSRAVVLADLQIVLSAFTIFTEPELARPRAYDRERSTSSSRVKPFHSRAQEFARARASESENKHGSPPDHP